MARSLFSDVCWAWLWLILRVYVGWQWLEAGWGKHSNPATVSINPVLFIIATWLVGA